MNTVPEITQNHLNGKTLAEFADSLGVEVTPQSIHHWKEGNRMPEIMFLFKVIGSPTATPDAREWARECMNVLTGFDVNLSEPAINKEVEQPR